MSICLLAVCVSVFTPPTWGTFTQNLYCLQLSDLISEVELLSFPACMCLLQHTWNILVAGSRIRRWGGAAWDRHNSSPVIVWCWGLHTRGSWFPPGVRGPPGYFGGSSYFAVSSSFPRILEQEQEVVRRDDAFASPKTHSIIHFI